MSDQGTQIRGFVHAFVRQYVVARQKTVEKKLLRGLLANFVNQLDEFELTDDEWLYVEECVRGDWDIEGHPQGRPRAPYRIAILMKIYFEKSIHPEWTWDQCCNQVYEKVKVEPGLNAWVKNTNSNRSKDKQLDIHNYIFEVWRSNRGISNPYG